MARRIFEDNEGLYFRAYDKNKRLVKVYCDEEGNPLRGRKVVPIILEEEEGVAFGRFSLKKLTPLLISLLAVILIIFGGYFVYSKYANSNSTVDISGYDISFAPTGYNGEAKAGIKVNKIPTVSNVKDEAQKKEIDEILKNPRVSYNKAEGLRNGDDVEATVILDETKVKKYNLQVTGTYKKTFKVENLTEKPAVTGINPKDSDQSSETSSTSSSDKTSAEGSEDVKTSTKPQVDSQGTQGTIPVPRTVSPAVANIRSGAGTNTAVTGTISRGKQVTEIRRVQNAKGETWSQVTYGNGKKGWIKSNLLG